MRASSDNTGTGKWLTLSSADYLRVTAESDQIGRVAAVVHTYVDGESLFHRAWEMWKLCRNLQDAKLEDIRYRDDANGDLLLVSRNPKVFWSRRFSPGSRVHYFTSFSGDSDGMYKARVALNEFGLEAFILEEDKQLLSQRDRKRNSEHLIEKPKGVDAQLFVQILEDAFARRFDICHIYTCDEDFAPIAAAVRRLGLSVYVHGFDCMVKRKSNLRVVARFVDLEPLFRSEFVNKCEVEL